MRTSCPRSLVLIVLGLAASLAACSGSDAPAAAAPKTEASATPTAPAAPAPAVAPTAPAATPAGTPAAAKPAEPVDLKVGGVTIRMEGNTITSGDGADADGFSLVDLEIAAEPPLKLKLRVDPALAPQLQQELADQKPSLFAIKDADGARVTLRIRIGQPSFTIAGRTIDVSGGKLSVCGIAMGAIADLDTITLARGEVRVEDRFRGPLPAPVVAR